jgi:hypothetical protein
MNEMNDRYWVERKPDEAESGRPPGSPVREKIVSVGKNAQLKPPEYICESSTCIPKHWE